MPILRAVTEFQMVSGVPQDTVVNRLHFDVVSDGASTTDLIVTSLQNFYQRFDEFLSVNLALTGHTVTWYNMDEAEPRVPLRVNALVLSAQGTTAAPSEVSLCLSFEGARVSGVAQARRRNRIYLGPWAKAASVDSTGRPSATVLTNVATSADLLKDDSDAAASWHWIVRSEMTGATAPVNNGWVDNAWDTQRRRGVAPTSRTAFA